MSETRRKGAYMDVNRDGFKSNGFAERDSQNSDGVKT
jgi:hypothetical protein